MTLEFNPVRPVAGVTFNFSIDPPRPAVVSDGEGDCLVAPSDPEVLADDGALLVYTPRPAADGDSASGSSFEWLRPVMPADGDGRIPTDPSSPVLLVDDKGRKWVLEAHRRKPRAAYGQEKGPSASSTRHAAFLDQGEPLAKGEEVTSLAAAGGGEGGGDGGHPGDYPTPESVKPGKIVGCAMSGSLLAVATLQPGPLYWQVSQVHSRMFHLRDRSQEGLRNFAREVNTFLSGIGAEKAVSCRTKSGSWTEGLEDEARIEVVLMMLPGVPMKPEDNDRIADWVLSKTPPSPDNMPQGRMTFAQVRAIEAALYTAARVQ